jgi:topoisomerase IA-like protein
MLTSITFEEAEKLLLDKFAKSRELGNLSSGEKVILEKVRWGYRLKAGSKSKLLKAKECENLTLEEALKILGVENV